MAISIAVASVIGSVFKEAFKFGGSMRKETIGLALTPAIVSMYNTMSEACIESCTYSDVFFAPSGLQYAAVIMGVVALTTHLNQKRKDELAKGK